MIPITRQDRNKAEQLLIDLERSYSHPEEIQHLQKMFEWIQRNEKEATERADRFYKQLKELGGIQQNFQIMGTFTPEERISIYCILEPYFPIR